MVTTSNQQDGAPSSSPPNPPSQAEQRPPPAENSHQVSHSSPEDHTAEAPSPLRDGVSSDAPSNPPTLPEQTPTAAGNSSQESQSSPSEPATEAAPLKHPAPLPERPRVASDPSWKRKPPKFPLLIYEVPIGVVLSWNFPLTPKYEEVKKYELFWYKEGAAPPSTSLWLKIRDVDASALPMACSVSQLLGGHIYHFAIRAVDVHGRYGKFSEIRSMFIEQNKVTDELRAMAAAKAAAKATAKAKVGEEASAASAKDFKSEAMDSTQAKDGECLVSEGKDVEEKSAGLPSDSVTPVKEVEKTVGCAKESEMAVGQSKEQDKDVAQGREQDKAKGQAKEQDKEMVQVKEEKERSPCSC